VYPTSETDANGKPYNGANKYVIHFPKGQKPPVKAFWSITMYDSQYFFVPNKLNRYDVSERNALKANPDGSTDIYIQKDSPGADKETNWLPAPAGKFILMDAPVLGGQKTAVDSRWIVEAVGGDASDTSNPVSIQTWLPFLMNVAQLPGGCRWALRVRYQC